MQKLKVTADSVLNLLWCLFVDGASVKVDHSEQAAAVDVKMTESDTAGEQPSSDAADTKHKFDAKQTEPSSEPKGAEPLAASADKGKAKEEADKGGDDKKEGKEKVVDEDLLRAFRYFDKTGERLMGSVHMSLLT